MKMPIRLGTGLLCLLFAPGVSAIETGFGYIDADLRLRYESVEQDNALRDAEATTLHARLGFTSKSWNALSLSIQGEAVTALGNDEYNSGPGGNGNTAYSVIPDPEGEQLNQLWLAYNGFTDTVIKLGRQRLIYDNARFVGNVGWRQNEQTYDGLTLTSKSLGKTTIQLAHVTQVNNIFFQAKELDRANLLNLSHEYSAGNKIGAYAYYLDYAPGDGPDQRTWGLHADGQLFKSESVTGRYRLEYAKQSDYADAASNFDLGYSLAELALSFGPTVKLGIETLEGDGSHGFTTPLATLHAFNGWADQFLATPGNGLVDRYVGITGKAVAVKLALIYHDYASDIGSVDYGSEWNASLGFSPLPGWSLLLKFADYSADATKADTTKLWLQAAYTFK